MGRIFYEVTATFQSLSLADAWADWLRTKHIADVIDAGALSGKLIKLDEPAMTLAAQYEFGSRRSFEAYLRDHAPRLRAEGLSRFGTDQVTYSRRAGEILDEDSAK